MNYKEFNVAVPIKANNVILIEGIVQHDTANIINVRLMDGVEPFDFTGYAHIFLEILKPDGNVVQAAVTNNNDILNIDQLGVPDNDPYTFHVVDPSDGRLTFTLRDQATILAGTHFLQLVIMSSNGERMTTSRINYYVGEAMLNDLPGIESSSDYRALYTMYSELSYLGTSEKERQEAEAQRVTAEINRAAEYQELKDDIDEYFENARDYVDVTETYMQSTQKMYNAIIDKQMDYIQEAIVDLMLLTREEATELIDSAVRDFDAGTFSDNEDIVKLLKMKTGVEADLPALDVGEPAWASDSETMYVGGADGPVPINGVYVAGTESPERTDLLWIDTSAGSVIKYYDGETWQPTATATFA